MTLTEFYFWRLEIAKQEAKMLLEIAELLNKFTFRTEQK